MSRLHNWISMLKLMKPLIIIMTMRKLISTKYLVANTHIQRRRCYGLVDGVDNILDFPVESQVYDGSTVVLKAGNSDFVKTKHVDRIKSSFPNYTLVAVRTYAPRSGK